MKTKAVTGLLLIAFLTSPSTGDDLGTMLVTQQEASNERSVNIAMCQIFCLDGDREGNFVRIENALG